MQDDTHLPCMTSSAAPVTRYLPGRPEYWLAGGFLATAVFVIGVIKPPSAKLDYAIYYQLASCFVSGTLDALLVVFAERLMQPLRPGVRKIMRGCWLGLASALTVLLMLTVHPPKATELSRLMESVLLSLFCTVILLTAALLVCRLARLRDLWLAAAEVLSLWAPYLAYLSTGGVIMSATLVHTPLLYDPVLLRMDVSLGFSPTETVFNWVHPLPWTKPFNDWGYPLLGCFLAVVAAALHLARELAHCRRCLMALTCVAALGLTCYQLVPAISPVLAYPKLLARTASTPEQKAKADQMRNEILNGPVLLAAPPSHPRNVMPSLHTAFTLVALTAAWSWRRRFFWLCLPVGMVQIITTMTLGVHYLVDLFAAVPLAALSWWLGDQSVRRRPVAWHAPLPAEKSSARDTAIFVSALGTSVIGFIVWGCLAPIPPWVAWPLVALCAGGPAWASIRLHHG